MTKDEYNLLYHEADLNLVCFKQLLLCDNEILRLVNMALDAEREACAKICDSLEEFYPDTIAPQQCAMEIRARKDK